MLRDCECILPEKKLCSSPARSHGNQEKTTNANRQ